MITRTTYFGIVTLLGLAILPQAGQSAVTSASVDDRTVIADGRSFGESGAYERIKGEVCIALDPRDPHNALITDLELAPTNADGLVEACANYLVLQPRNPSMRTGLGFVEVSNRGGKAALRYFNRAEEGSNDPLYREHIGDGFLMEQGFSILWVGWQYDIEAGDDRLTLTAPRVSGNGAMIRGLVRSDWVIDEDTASLSLGHNNIPAFYDIDNPRSNRNQLTVRSGRDAQPRIIPNSQWRAGYIDPDSGTFRDSLKHITLEGGFKAGNIYEFVYEAIDPAIGGMGFAMVRDFVDYAKSNPRAPFPIETAIGFGVSQTGRYLRHFLSLDFNRSERDQKVFDGVLIHTAGAGRGSFNHRFGQPSRDGHAYSAFHYPTDIFPFSSADQEDPITGEEQNIFSQVTNDSFLPKIFYTNSGYEYWGRAASLTHTQVDGRGDLRLRSFERMYHIASAQHFPVTLPPNRCSLRETGDNRGSPVEIQANLRALLVHLRDWTIDNDRPPSNNYPTLRSGSLVEADQLNFPHIPGILAPTHPHTAYILDYGPRWSEGIIDLQPPTILDEITPLVPQVSPFGNEIGGIRNVELRVPLATYTPWSLRTGLSNPTEINSFCGMFLPLPLNSLVKELTGDSRSSIDELYSSRDDFLQRVEVEAIDLVNEGFLLEQDIPYVVNKNAEIWDHIHRELNEFDAGANR